MAAPGSVPHNPSQDPGCEEAAGWAELGHSAGWGDVLENVRHIVLLSSVMFC